MMRAIPLGEPGRYSYSFQSCFVLVCVQEGEMGRGNNSHPLHPRPVDVTCRRTAQLVRRHEARQGHDSEEEPASEKFFK